ncbi:SRPBCC domain-containing protein [Kineosporia sp. J2-2]|uniref:SRPBCC domain-containing protein n=1 Tax=Kineosporia corallincola TaxID=2835133 RepID=A0ABS5TE88_9ACTN|nr:SRPBCC domain-containing protein [Kineosporia corallincola]MBT0769402.1 SRPBCC domain-containing protein [Kineosporia corallincola]
MSREFAVAPSLVFRVFEDDELRLRWFRMPGRGAGYHLDFRVGGAERAGAVFPTPDGDEIIENRSRWLHIDPGRRLVQVYETFVNQLPMWTALVTIELWPDGDGTRLDWTEQVAFLNSAGDGEADLPHLRGATVLRLNGVALAVEAAQAAKAHRPSMIPAGRPAAGHGRAAERSGPGAARAGDRGP